MQRGKYSLVVELKSKDGSNNINKELCTSDSIEALKDASFDVAKNQDVPKIVPFKSELNGTEVLGVNGYTRNALIVNSDQIEELDL